MLWVNYSRPEPNPEVEQKVRAALKQWDELLDIRWFENINYNEKQQVYEGRYALACTWPSSDPRWQMYHNGEIGEPVDILGWFAEDMHNAGTAALDPDSIWPKVQELLANADNTRIPWRERLRRNAEHNKELKQKRRKDFLENEVHDLATYHRNEGLNIQQIAVPTNLSKD